jgi:D-alanyl-D-alanine dipeptidase
MQFTNAHRLCGIMQLRRLMSTLLLFSAPALFFASGLEDGDCQQCVLVLTADWDAVKGKLFPFERETARDQWKMYCSPVAVVVGAKGIAWGSDLSDRIDLPGPAKKEGDKKGPAGYYPISSAFGYASTANGLKLSYRPLKASIEAIDDPRSRYYNQIVDRSEIPNPDWHSSEKMFRTDDLYKWGIVVDYNTPPQPGRGSCIFLHLWRNSSSGTAGCTAMAERDLIKIMRWLDPAKRPMFVQLTRPMYKQLREKWNLPGVEGAVPSDL